MITIRNEKKEEYQIVEDMIRRAFYNIYIPGCYEHYLVHTMREHPDFIEELDFVIELDGKIIGNVMYTKALLIDENKNEKEIVTFGPLCIDPYYQRQGYGKKLLEHSFKVVKEMGYDTIVIFGSPANYVSRGFKCCQRFNVSIEGQYPAAMMVKELIPHALDNHIWHYYESPIMAIDEKKAQEYDETLEPMEKKILPSQEEFYIMSNSFIK